MSDSEALLMLRINEIFFSLQGETTTVGIPTVFVRLTGCPLRCQYCDTAYAFSKGELISEAAILAQIKAYSTDYVTVTGGEPLAQPNCLGLLTQLSNLGYQVSLETSGALSVAGVDPRVIKILDVKTPGSAEVHRNLFDNFNYLLPHDQVKFVICDRMDYEWAKKMCDHYQLTSACCAVLFSPSYTELEPARLANWIVEDQLQVRFQLQMHKYLWGDCPGK